MKRAAQPALSPAGEVVLTHYEQRLRVEEDLSATTIRNYLSDLRQFAAWCEGSWQQGREDGASFLPTAVTTPTLTDYQGVTVFWLPSALQERNTRCRFFDISVRLCQITCPYWRGSGAFVPLGLTMGIQVKLFGQV